MNFEQWSICVFFCCAVDFRYNYFVLTVVFSLRLQSIFLLASSFLFTFPFHLVAISYFCIVLNNLFFFGGVLFLKDLSIDKFPIQILNNIFLNVCCLIHHLSFSAFFPLLLLVAFIISSVRFSEFWSSNVHFPVFFNSRDVMLPFPVQYFSTFFSYQITLHWVRILFTNYEFVSSPITFFALYLNHILVAD